VATALATHCVAEGLGHAARGGARAGRLGHRTGYIARERYERVTVAEAMPASGDRPGYCIRKFCRLGCRAQRAEAGLMEISLKRAYSSAEGDEEPVRWWSA
jgi:hypothetical protein